MSPWLFNLFMDAVMKEVREKACDVGVTQGMKEEILNGRLIG